MTHTGAYRFGELNFYQEGLRALQAFHPRLKFVMPSNILTPRSPILTRFQTRLARAESQAYHSKPEDHKGLPAGFVKKALVR